MVLDAVDALYRPIFLLAAGAGLRQGEILGLTLDRIDFEGGTVKIDRQLQRGRLVPLKSEASYRTVPLAKIVIEAPRNERVLDATMEGPILLAKLAPGTYTVKATSDAQTQAKTVTIPTQGQRQLDFRWDRKP